MPLLDAEGEGLGAVETALRVLDYNHKIEESACLKHIQEAHITAGHIICYLVEEMLFGGLK